MVQRVQDMTTSELEEFLRRRQYELRLLSRGDPYGPSSDGRLEAAQEEYRKRVGHYFNIDA
jgi:hypothetical protein